MSRSLDDVLVFCDTSSLVKLSIEEEGSAAMRRLVHDSTVTVASLAYAEALATFSRRYREGHQLAAAVGVGLDSINPSEA